jgi:hypothetical protein
MTEGEAIVMTEGYSHDVFLSFPRSGGVREWIAIHFLPLLSEALGHNLPREPTIFSDLSMELGVPWPIQLGEALRHSR